jgi:hypothetical protein
MMDQLTNETTKRERERGAFSDLNSVPVGYVYFNSTFDDFSVAWSCVSKKGRITDPMAEYLGWAI